MSSGGSHDAITPQRVIRILWRRKLICLIVTAAVFLAGVSYALTRPKTYQSTSSVALLPISTNPGILPNYPNLITSLIPTYVQLVSSPALLNKVAATLPFAISETKLAQQVHAQSLSSAAVVDIVAQSRSPVQAQQIAARATTVFLAELNGNGVVVPRIYAQPALPAKPVPPSTRLLLGVLFILAAILGLGAGLLWDRLSGEGESEDSTTPPAEPTRPPILGVIPGLPEQSDASVILRAREISIPRSKWNLLGTNFMYSTAGHRVHSVTVTSLHPSRDKTTVAVNLAASLAELGLSVVLVDGVVQDPSLHEVFGIGNARGLTSSVHEDTDPASLLIPVPSVPGLQVVTAGPPLLPSRSEVELYLQHLQRFCRLGDLVIVDGPALQGGAAAGMVVSATDAVVLVVPSGNAWPEIVGADLRILEQHGAPVVGTVLTAADGAVHGNGRSRAGDTDRVPGKTS